MSDEAQDTGAPIPPPLESPSPEDAAQQFKEELEAAVADIGGGKPRNGHTVKKEEPAKEPEKKPEPPKPEPAVTQERLSSGYAKLTRQQKAVEKREQALAAKEADLAKQREEFDRTHTERTTAIETRAADVEKLLKLFDEDEEACLAALAERRKTTVDSFYDKLTRRRLNGGVRAPEDQVAEVKAEVDALKREKAERDAAEQEKAEQAKKDEELRQAKAAYDARIVRENTEFAQFCKSKDEKDAIRFPLLSQEPDEDIVNTARQVIAGAVAANQSVSYLDVANHLEKMLRLHALEEAQKAKAEEPETPKSAPKQPEGKKAESAKAKTLTNSVSAPRILRGEGTPQNDGERMALALKAWEQLSSARK